MAGAHQLIQRCQMVSCRWEPLDTDRACFATTGEAALSALQKLYIPQPGPRHAPLREAVVSFMISRRLSGHPIEVEYERLSQ
jgi:hypothetical protein